MAIPCHRAAHPSRFVCCITANDAFFTSGVTVVWPRPNTRSSNFIAGMVTVFTWAHWMDQSFVIVVPICTFCGLGHSPVYCTPPQLWNSFWLISYIYSFVITFAYSWAQLPTKRSSLFPFGQWQKLSVDKVFPRTVGWQQTVEWNRETCHVWYSIAALLFTWYITTFYGTSLEITSKDVKEHWNLNRYTLYLINRPIICGDLKIASAKLFR